MKGQEYKCALHPGPEHKLCFEPHICTTVQTAIDLDPKNPLAKFERAAVLMSLEHLDEALAELHALKVWIPAHQSVDSTSVTSPGNRSSLALQMCILPSSHPPI